MKALFAGVALLFSIGQLHGTTTTVSTVTQLENTVFSASNGDTILVADGTYTLTGPPNSGIGLNITASITLKSVNGAGNVTFIAAPAPNNYISININASNVTIDGFTLTGGAVFGVSAGAYSGLILRNLAINITGTDAQGISFAGTTNSIIELCSLTNTPFHAIAIGGGSNYNYIVNNTIQTTQTGDGVALVTSDHNVVAGNTISNTYFDGVSVNGSQYNYIGQNSITLPHNGVTLTNYVTNTGTRQCIGNYIGNNTMLLSPTKPPGGSDGIWLNYDSDYNMAFMNDTSQASENSVAVFNSVGNYLRGNIFHQNTQGGIYVVNTQGPSGTTPPAYNSIQQNYLYEQAANGNITLDTAPNTDVSFNFMSGYPNTTISLASPYGLLFRDNVSNTSALSNVIQNLAGDQIYADDTGISLYLNRYLNAPIHYTISGAGVQWDSGSTALGGNYFSDFTTANGNPSNGATPYTGILDNVSPADYTQYKDHYPYQSESLGRQYLISPVLPAQGSQLAAGTYKTISWTSQACVLVDINLIGAGTTSIATNSPDYGYYRWMVPSVTPGAYTIQVNCKDSGGTVHGIGTTGTFNITTSDLVLLSPQTNLMLDSTNSMMVSWAKSANVTLPVNVYIRYANSATYGLLQSGVTNDFVRISTASTSSNQVSVMISSGSYADSTDGAFTIRASTTGTFVAPAPASQISITEGYAYPVEWVSPQTTAYVNIDLIGAATKNIATQLADFGKYLMLVPGLPGAAYLRLTFYSATGTVLGTSQSATFIIAPTGILPTAVSVSPVSGTGVSQVFTAVFSDASGYSYLNDRTLLINSTINGSGACLIQVDPGGTYLLNDAGGSFLGPLTPSGTLSNSQCTLNGPGTSVVNSGSTSTANLSVTFNSNFAGTKNLYMNAGDMFGNHSGYVLEGTYTVVGTTLSNSVTPTSASGSSQVFTAVFSDSSGFSYLNDRTLLINSSLNGAGACLVQVDPGGTYLLNDSGGAFLGPLSGSGTLSNSQCTLNGSGSSVVNSGNNSTATLSITFNAAFAGAKNLYMNTGDTFGNHTGYLLKGTYTVAGGVLANSVTPSSASGSSQVFTAIFSDTSGSAYLNDRTLLINSVLNGAGACFVQVDPGGTYLLNDSGGAFLGPLTPTGTLSNSQCTLNGSGSSVVNSGNTTTATLSISFSGSFIGAKNLYMNTGDIYGNHSGYVSEGTYTVVGALSNSVTPTSASGSSQVFTAVFTDSAGFSYLNDRTLLINSVLNGAGACFVQVDPGGTYLLNDAGNAFLGPLSGSGTLSNSQCTLNGSGSSVVNSGNTSTATLSITFNASFAGTKNLYMNTGDIYGNHTGYVSEGTYTVAGGALSNSVTPNSGSGSSQVFTAVFTDTSGFSYLNDRTLLINSVLNGAGGCFVQVVPGGTYLLNDAGNGFTGPLTGSGTLSNSQCTLNGSGSMVVNSGNTTTATLSITFTATFIGAKNLYMNTGDIYGNHNGYQSQGTYTVVGALSNSLTPTSGSGLSQTFTAVFSDAAGYAYLNDRTLLINSVLNGAGGCFVQVDPGGTYLLNDAGTGFTGPLTGSGTLSNSQCTVNGSGSSVVNSGNNTTATLSITFNGGFTGAKNTYMNTGDIYGNHTGYVLKGTFTP